MPSKSSYILAIVTPLIYFITATSFAAPPKLAVLISVDQLRGDYLIEMESRFGEGGFRRLISQGVWYDNAHFAHACTYTATGHATLSTGGNVPEHGMVGNRWYDPVTGDSLYSASDPDTKLIGLPSEGKSGASPKNLLAETVGDVLHRSTGGQAKIFSLSQKDRASIMLSGKQGKAFWYHSGSARFISSSYYFDTFPAWAAAWNDKSMADTYAGKIWDLLDDSESYRYIDEDERSVELGNSVLGKTFPHTLPAEPGGKLYSALSSTPYYDEIALDFARNLIESENIGEDDVPDLLLISLSATDLIGHGYGPYSLEQEDNLLRLDRNLAAFFTYLDDRIGMDNIVIALSADHGVDGRPKKDDGTGYRGDIVSPKAIQGAADAALTEAYGKTFTRRFYVPYLYLNEQALEEAGVSLADAERVAAKAISEIEGIAVAISRADILSGTYDEADPLMQRVAKSVHPDRSGHVAVFSAPYYQIVSRRGLFTATHGSPWAYDTHVPVLFAGKNIPHQQRINRPVGPEHIAPTLSALLGIDAPNKATKPALKEVLGED